MSSVGGRQQQRHGAQLVHRRDERGRRADPGHFLDDDHGGDGVGPGAAVLLGNVDGVQVGLDQGVMSLLRELRRLVYLGRVRRDLLLGQGTHRLAQRIVLLGQGEGRKIVAHALDGRTS